MLQNYAVLLQESTGMSYLHIGRKKGFIFFCVFLYALSVFMPGASFVRADDAALADFIRSGFNSRVAQEVPGFVDARGNGILWYLTYREDQHADGGFACPRTAQTLISLGADPFRENELGLCWNDVARHFVR